MTSWSSAESHLLSFSCERSLVSLDFVKVVTVSHTVSVLSNSFFFLPSGIISYRLVTILSDISQALWLLSWSDLSFFAFMRYLKTGRGKTGAETDNACREVQMCTFGERRGDGSSDISHLESRAWTFKSDGTKTTRAEQKKMSRCWRWRRKRVRWQKRESLSAHLPLGQVSKVCVCVCDSWRERFLHLDAPVCVSHANTSPDFLRLLNKKGR